MFDSLPQKTKKKYSAPALSKGLDILEMLASEPTPKGLKEIAEGLGRSRSEIFRMIRVLEDRGYVKLDAASDQYSLSLKVFEIAHQHNAVGQLSSVAGPVMEKLSAITGQSCHLTVLSGGKIIVIAQQDAVFDCRFGLKLGLHVSTLNTCSGHLFLAYSSQEERNEILSNHGGEDRSQLSKVELKQTIDRVLRNGYEKIKSPQVLGITDIGYPLFDKSSKIVACLVIPFLELADGSHKLDMQSSLDHLKKAATVISWHMGYTDNNL